MKRQLRKSVTGRTIAVIMAVTLAFANISYAASITVDEETTVQDSSLEEGTGKADSDHEEINEDVDIDAVTEEESENSSVATSEISYEEIAEDMSEEDAEHGLEIPDVGAEDGHEEDQTSTFDTADLVEESDSERPSDTVLQGEEIDVGLVDIQAIDEAGAQSDDMIIGDDTAPDMSKEDEADLGESSAVEEDIVMETVLPRLEASSSYITIYGIDGNQYVPSDFDTDYVALFYGRTGCSNTLFMMEKLEQQLDPDRPSVKVVLMDIDSSDAALEAYAEEYPDRFVSHHERYILQYYQLTGTSDSVSLPGLVIIDNVSGDVAFSSQGLAQEELYSFLEGAGIMLPIAMCTFKLGGTADYPAAFEALEILNEKRIAAGLRPLVMDESLLAAAMQRAAEIYYYYYSDHSRPDGSRCFTAFPAASGMAENIAGGWLPSAQSAITTWSNSPGHNKNMMDPDMTDIGIGCFYTGDSLSDGNVRWVQTFACGNSRRTASSRNAAYKEFSIKAVSDTVSVGLDEDEIQLYVGETYTPELLYITDGGGTGPLITTFTETDDSTVASVSSSGTISGKSLGSTTVRIGVDEDHYAEVTVNVVERPVAVQFITLNMEKTEIKVGDILQLHAVLSPSNATNKAVTWSVSDSRILSVDQTGNVTALKTGTAVVTAITKDGGYRASCEVKVLFTDVPASGKYYCDPVYWAADKGITAGYADGSFGVGRDCERREVMIFLWRYAGQPTGYGDARTMFNDMDAYGSGSAANKAVAWAYKTGIAKGYGDGGFHPTAPIVRKDVMIMMYRLAKKPAISGTLSFTDCQGYNRSSDTYKAILWGSKNGITNGYSSGQYKGQFGVGLNCLREQIVTFLYRYNQKQH